VGLQGAARSQGAPPPALLLVVDESGCVRIAEGDALASLGLVSTAVEGRPAADVLREVPELQRGIDSALAGRPTTSTVQSNGLALALSFTPRRDREGSPAGAVVSALDAVLLEDTDHEIRERERRMGLVFRQVPGAIWATDRDLRITYALGKPPARAGFDVEHIIGTSVYDIVETDDPSHPVIAHHLAALAGREARFELEFRGSWFEILIRPLRDASGAIVGCVAAGTDQTERCRTKRALERSKAQLAEAQEIARLGSFEWHVGRDRLTWSEMAPSVLGLDAGDLGGSIDGLLARVHPDDVDDLKTRVFDAVREGRPFACDVRIVRGDRSARTFHVRSKIVSGRGGRTERVIGCLQDVTEARRTTRALEESVSLLQATLEATADGILVVDLEGRIVVYNQRFLELWELPPEVVARCDDDALLARVRAQLEDPAGFIRDVRERYARIDSESSDTLHFRDGRIYERHSRPQKLADEIVGRVWSFRDVTEHDRLLRRSQLLADTGRLLASLEVETALESVARLIVPRLAEACAVDLFDEAGPRRLFEITRDDVRSIVGEPHPTVLDGHASLYRRGSAQYLGVPLVSQRGLLGAVTLLAPRERELDAAAVKFAEELGRRFALALENAHAYQEVQNALRARDEFLAIAAHELRGPLTAMRLAVQTLEAGTVSQDRTFALIEVIGRENRRLARFTDELLDVGRIRAGNLRFDLEDVDLGDVVHDVVGRMHEGRARSRAPLSVSTQGDLVGTWDRLRLEQVVTNLLSNAMKFGRGKPVTIDVHEADDRVVLSVRDQGIGVPPELREQIFRPFDRAVSSRNYGGLGLGLYIVRKIVEGFGGGVRVEDPGGEGSRFVVELPKTRAM
jgi:PAS domain S-box-containing protein